MKIIQIMPEFGLAGAEIMCENLIYELVEQGEEVVVVSLYDYHSAITERLEKKNIKVIYLHKKPGLDFSMIIKLVKLFKIEKPDVIHTHRYVMQYAIPAAIITGIKQRVHTVHNVAKKENSNLARKVNFLFFKFAHVIPVALSEKIQKTIEEEYRINIKKIPVILNGIDLKKCLPKSSYNLNNPIRILHIGRFSEQKNHEGLVQAFALFVKLHPDSKLILVGDGEKKTHIENLVNEFNLSSKVLFCGIQSDIYGYLHDADIFILPSLYEGVPMTLIEAMGTGLPIVATAVGGVPDMLNNEKEALLTSKNVDELCAALNRFVEDQSFRELCGNNALKRSQLFASKYMADQYISIYKK
jgi:glycosyltransferase involved in cell wall biosynthesis